MHRSILNHFGIRLRRFRSNVRRDNLEKFWRHQFSQKHALMLTTSFFENVDREGKTWCCISGRSRHNSCGSLAFLMSGGIRRMEHRCCPLPPSPMSRPTKSGRRSRSNDHQYPADKCRSLAESGELHHRAIAVDPDRSPGTLLRARRRSGLSRRAFHFNCGSSRRLDALKRA
jgi:hypothetical protein